MGASRRARSDEFDQFADAQRDIEPLADHIDQRVAQVEINRDLGISFQEIRQDWRDPAETEGHRCGQPHHAARCSRLREQRVLGGFGVRQQPGRAVGESVPGIGQSEAPGRAVEQPRPEPLL